jgi:hypothetical protein
MYELYCRKRAYSGIPPGSIIERVYKQGLRPRFPSATPRSYAGLAEACWQVRRVTPTHPPPIRHPSATLCVCLVWTAQAHTCALPAGSAHGARRPWVATRLRGHRLAPPAHPPASFSTCAPSFRRSGHPLKCTLRDPLKCTCGNASSRIRVTQPVTRPVTRHPLRHLPSLPPRPTPRSGRRLQKSRSAWSSWQSNSRRSPARMRAPAPSPRTSARFQPRRGGGA